MNQKNALQFVALTPDLQQDVSQHCTWGDDASHTHTMGAFKPNRQLRRAFQASGSDISGDGYLRLEAVLRVYPVSRSAWYEGMAANIYPQSVPLGKRAVGWTRESIRQLLANPPKF